MSKKFRKSSKRPREQAVARFLGRTATLMGLGGYKTGSGVAATLFLIGRVKKLIVTDVKSARELAPQIKIVKNAARSAAARAAGGHGTKIVWHLGRHIKKDFTDVDFVVRNPDIPYYSEFLRAARAAGVPIENDITLFLRMHGFEETLAVTGTRGKTTTTHLLFEMVREFDKNAFMAGNVGFSPLLESAWRNPARPAVFEFSSFMLHEFGEQAISPHIAVVTNLFADHLNKYKGMKDYAADKKNIFLHQKPGAGGRAGGVAIFNADNKIIREWGLCERARRARMWGRGDSVKFFSLIDLRPFKRELKSWRLPGKHNLQNLAGAVVAAKAYGVPDKCIKKIIKNFRGVPYRLELVRETRAAAGARDSKPIKWYNDSTATSPEGAMAALNSFPARKIILISGGNSKGLALKEFSALIKKRARVLIKVRGNASAKMPSKIPQGQVINVHGLPEAVRAARKSAHAGDVILFSPGLTWLPQINEFARGDLFKSLVKKL